MAERRKITPIPKSGIVERKMTGNGGKFPQNPKRGNDGKSSEILKDRMNKNVPKC